MKTLNQIKILWLITGCVLICGPALKLNAQDTNVDWNTASDEEVLLQAIELTTPTPSNEVPAFATFYSARHPPISRHPWPPLPGNVDNLSAWDLGSNIWIVDDLGLDYNALSAQASHSMTAMDDSEPPFPGGGGGTSGSTPALNGVAPPNYSTNIWIAQQVVSGGNFTGIVSNTIADVEYQLLYANSLNPPVQWQPVPGGIVYGPETTNDVAWSIPFDPTTNFFLNVLSYQDDGSGLPLWWELEYYGQDTNVDPYAEPEGDGWNNLEIYQMGLNPFSWITPPAPQGLAIDSFNNSSGTATLSWQPSPGPVTGYTIQIFFGLVGTVNVGNVTSYVDTESFVGDNYSVEANYAGGPSAWSSSVSVQGSSTISIVPGPQGNLYLVASYLPSDLSAIQITLNSWNSGGPIDNEFQQSGNYIDQGNFPTDTLNNSSFQIPASAITNGICEIPPSDVSAFYPYQFEIETIRSNGVTSVPIQIGSQSGSTPLAEVPFIDGRADFKDNLRFLFRAANDLTAQTSFQFINSQYTYLSFNWPSDYAWVDFYNDGANYFGYITASYPDALEPLEDNIFYKNFVFDANNLTNTLGEAIPNTGITYQFANSTLDLAYNYSQVEYSLNVSTFLSDPVVPAPAISPSDSTYITPSWFGGLYFYYENFPQHGDTNIYGLTFVAAEGAWYTNNEYYNQIYYPQEGSFNGWPYPDAQQPDFQIVNYYFCRPGVDPMPESGNFASTNKTPLIIVPVGGQQALYYPGKTSLQLAGYAQVAVTNAFPGVYGYLGQYFTNAYEIDSNGNVTANTTGILSPYGQFFATEPGPAALVTMPDIDTGQQGTCTVYCVSLNVDKNHDGTMDTSFTGPDTTSAGSPYVFWANNNFDRWVTPISSDQYQDDVLYDTPLRDDCDYETYLGQRAIPDTRDLEDFTRLWVCGVNSNLLAALPPGSTVTLNWGDVGNPNTNNPTIDLFTAADTDGGIGYLTNELIASNQVDIDQYPYIGRLGPGDSLQLNATNFVNDWAGSYFIWCGVSYGTGGLNLTIANSNGTVIAQTTAYIQIEDIKQMYERWTVGDAPSRMPTTTPVLACTDLPIPGQPPFQYPTPQGTNTPYILYVHGWNEDYWYKDRHAETAFKRLYWQGYQGRFGIFRWPTTSGETATAILSGGSAEAVEDDYNWSEYLAWESAAGLLNLLTNLDAEYNGQVYLFAHSLGNVVAGEALRLAGSNRVVNVYVATQAALTAHLYDSTVPDTIFSTTVTPDVFNNWLATINGNGAGQVFNYYNTNDDVLGPAYWETDQAAKPSQSDQYGGPWGFYGTPYTEDSPLYTPGSVDDNYPWQWFENFATRLDIAASVTNYYEVMAWASQPRATALGITPDVGGFTEQVNLISIWPPDPYKQNYTDPLWHSGEFVNDYAQQQNYWNTLLNSTNEGFGL